MCIYLQIHAQTKMGIVNSCAFPYMMELERSKSGVIVLLVCSFRQTEQVVARVRNMSRSQRTFGRMRLKKDIDLSNVFTQSGQKFHCAHLE